MLSYLHKGVRKRLFLAINLEYRLQSQRNSSHFTENVTKTYRRGSFVPIDQRYAHWEVGSSVGLGTLIGELKENFQFAKELKGQPAKPFQPIIPRIFYQSRHFI